MSIPYQYRSVEIINRRLFFWRFSILFGDEERKDNERNRKGNAGVISNLPKRGGQRWMEGRLRARQKKKNTFVLNLQEGAILTHERTEISRFVPRGEKKVG